MQTRAMRNNNPGNLDRSQIPWQGEDRSPAALASEPRFAVFSTPEFGFRALGKQLLAYQDLHGLRTVRAIVDRWAPPSENDTGAYVDAVAAAINVGADDTIDLHQDNSLFGVAKAIAHHESGFDPWPDAIVTQGLALIGAGA